MSNLVELYISEIKDNGLSIEEVPSGLRSKVKQALKQLEESDGQQ